MRREPATRNRSRERYVRHLGGSRRLCVTWIAASPEMLSLALMRRRTSCFRRLFRAAVAIAAAFPDRGCGDDPWDGLVEDDVVLIGLVARQPADEPDIDRLGQALGPASVEPPGELGAHACGGGSGESAVVGYEHLGREHRPDRRDRDVGSLVNFAPSWIETPGGPGSGRGLHVERPSRLGASAARDGHTDCDAGVALRTGRKPASGCAPVAYSNASSPLRSH